MVEVQKRSQKRITVLYPLPDTTAKKEKKKQRVAAYCRVSSGSDEQMTSYHAQVKFYEKHIRENRDYIFSGLYADEGVSGTDLKKRDAFKRMMQDAREGKLDLIITKSISRFGRNTLDCLNSIRELKALGVDVYFEKENIHTMHNEGELLLTLLSAVAENESFTQSENVKWGIHRKYERGNVKSVPSGKFLGYDKDEDGNLVINEEQAAIVCRIYREFLDGYGTYQIAKKLTYEQVPMAYGGKEWCASHIKKVLNNEKYKGDTLFSKTFNADPLNKSRVKNTGQLPQHYFEDTHPAIIDKKTWELVQLEFLRQEEFIRAHNMDKYHYHSEKIPLSGKIICQCCGQMLALRIGVDGSYWRCLRHKSKKEPGQNICGNGIKIAAEKIALAFVLAWKELSHNRDLYERKWQHSIDSDNLLLSYRTKELLNLLDDLGAIETMPYELMLKTMSHIEVNQNGQITVVFLDDSRVEMQGKDFIYKRRAYRKNENSTDSWMALRRMELNMSQQQLAEKVGVKYTQILKIEKGHNTSKETAIRLGEILGIPWTRWFDR